MIFILYGVMATAKLNAQHNANTFLIGIIESFNQEYHDLHNFISSDAICVVDGSRSDSSALVVLKNNFKFLHSVYSHPEITIQHLVADNDVAMAEWVFTDSMALVASGMVSIHLKQKRIHLIRIHNGKVSHRTESDSKNKRIIPRRSGSRQQRPSEAGHPLWYYLRKSQGGFADPAGVYVSQIFSCNSPEIVSEAFDLSHLKGSFSSLQAAGQDRQINLTISQKADMEIFTKDVDCDN